MSCRINSLNACESKMGPRNMDDALKLHHNFLRETHHVYLDLIGDLDFLVSDGQTGAKNRGHHDRCAHEHPYRRDLSEEKPSK